MNAVIPLNSAANLDCDSTMAKSTLESYPIYITKTHTREGEGKTSILTVCCNSLSSSLRIWYHSL